MEGFDRHNYERPSQKWICGHAADGRSCRSGPDGRGNCRATFECQPFLEKKEGETKGHYRCTRPKEHGGPCTEGPFPNGACARPIPKCQPVPSLRARRGAFTFAVFSGTLALLLILLNSSSRLRFINPGPISAPHSGERFMQMHGQTSGCSACHANASLSTASWLDGAFRGQYGFSEIDKLATPGPPAMHALDRSCLKCHAGSDFHHRNVVQNHSCSACHREHRGAELSQTLDDAACARCHNDPASMRQGAVETFATFSEGHPEFDPPADKNSLRFNHRRHFEADIPLIDGKALECASCHAPDSSGAAHLRVTFENHCVKCHGLAFDARNPSLKIPHGDSLAVRSFLRSLPVQYADHARREKGISQQRDLNEFVFQQLTALRGEMRSEENLEGRVFQGCALCHAVTRDEVNLHVVAVPNPPDKWLPRGHFNHARHTSIACADCHHAERSSATSDVLMPRVESCVKCHSARGGVAHGCAVCHNFHNARR